MKPLAFICFTVLLSAPAMGQHHRFIADSASSQVSIKLNTTHEVVDGAFHLNSGVVNFDPATSHLSGEVDVSAGSGKTGNGSRDKRMYSILRVDQFATISFAPKAYTGTLASSGDSTLQVSGVFTLLGTPHEITIPMQIHITESKATATAHFKIPYVQWGLKNPSFLFWKAEDDVSIDLNLNGQVSE